MKKSALYIAAALAGTLGGGLAQAQQQFISIGTGGVTGVYYPTGGAICRLVNKDRKEHGIRCSAESTGGSIYNINTVRAGELEFGVAQSDWQYHALNGTSKFEDQGPFEGLRAVFSVHAEPVTVIAHPDSGIDGIDAVKGKRFNIGEPGSGIEGTWSVMEEAMGWGRDDLKLAAEMKFAETSSALCDGKIDGYFGVVGHPSAAVQEAVATCDAQLVAVTGDAIDKLVEENSFYRKAVVPAGMYNNEADVDTFGVGATFVSSADVPEEVVYVVVKAIFENFDAFKKLHPAFGNLKEEEMIADSLSAPLHDGAMKYYKERGWM